MHYSIDYSVHPACKKFGQMSYYWLCWDDIKRQSITKTQWSVLLLQFQCPYSYKTNTQQAIEAITIVTLVFRIINTFLQHVLIWKFWMIDINRCVKVASWWIFHDYVWANYAFEIAHYAFEQCSKIKPIMLKIMLNKLNRTHWYSQI